MNLYFTHFKLKKILHSIQLNAFLRLRNCDCKIMSPVSMTLMLVSYEASEEKVSSNHQKPKCFFLYFQFA